MYFYNVSIPVYFGTYNNLKIIYEFFDISKTLSTPLILPYLDSYMQKV